MKSLFLSLMSIMAASAFATPEPVNCRDIISYKPIYSGPVQCDDTYTQETCKVINSRTIDLITQTHTKTLYSSATPTTKSTMVLRELITFQESYGAGPGACTIPKTVTRELSCIADVPFSHNEEVKSTVCDYKPVAGFSVSPRVSSFVLTSTSSDYDGSIVSYRWIVNGSVASSSASLTLPHVQSEYINGRSYSRYEVSLEVTDNHGYKNTFSRSLLELNDECRTQSCRNR